jgi:hypothetical protein
MRGNRGIRVMCEDRRRETNGNRLFFSHFLENGIFSIFSENTLNQIY